MASRSAKKASDMKMKKTPGQDHLYDAQGSPEAKEAEDETPGFKKGGKAKAKHAKHAKGGHVEGEKAKHRADKKPRGMHHKRASGGRTPYSSGHNPPEPKEAGKTIAGHEGERPSTGA